MVHLKEDMSAFAMKLEGWRKAAQKAGRWFRRVEEEAESFVWKRHDAERCKAAERHAKAAAAPSTVGISKRLTGGGNGAREEGGGQGGKGGVLPKRLKSGSGHHRLEVCGPSNGRHKLAQGHHDSFASLRSSPSAIDALILSEPSAVFSQFLGSAIHSMVFFLSFLASSNLIFSFLFFSLPFRLLFRIIFDSSLLFSFLFFPSFFPMGLSLTCVCVVIGTTCNIYVVVFSGWQAVQRFFFRRD